MDVTLSRDPAVLTQQLLRLAHEAATADAPVTFAAWEAVLIAHIIEQLLRERAEPAGTD